MISILPGILLLRIQSAANRAAACRALPGSLLTYIAVCPANPTRELTYRENNGEFSFMSAADAIRRRLPVLRGWRILPSTGTGGSL
jgi:hypothetical protein